MNIHSISFVKEQNIGKSWHKENKILNEALNENCSIDKLNKSN